MTPQRVTLITLGVEDMTRAREFYRALGWQEVPGETESVTFYRMNGMALGLFGKADLAADQGRPGTLLGTGAITLAQNFNSDAAVDAAFDSAVSAGAQVLKRPERVFWGGYSGYFADPDGHAWELAHNPFFPLSDDGLVQLPD